ncbi:serine hydrolase [Frondihabitans sucicola]|uniref:Serine hydrolase n=1 Tax=Frondihabitans sucicola TaxID=1268041 RepID=A0ABN6XXY0_9MICO|nr:serine hydrolase domain-containing protein [Frondihabitans sucicola]BDZ49611.1 serine hydrolase [Frondihabitans sucicola]
MADRSRDLAAGVRELMTAALTADTYSGATCRVAIEGDEVASVAVGVLARIDDSGDEVSVDARQPVTEATLFDLASITKTYSAHTLLALVRVGVLDLDRPIADRLPTYREPVRREVTLRHLLTHTAGLPSTWQGWRPALAELLGARRAVPATPTLFRSTPLTDRGALLDDLLRTPLTAAPGVRFEYSCTGYNTAMALAETATGRPWSDLVDEFTLAPLGLADTGFTPEVDRSAATEYQPEFGRGVVRGIVHDEAAWSLGGACANAGLFASSSDLLAWGRSSARAAPPSRRPTCGTTSFPPSSGPGRPQRANSVPVWGCASVRPRGWAARRPDRAATPASRGHRCRPTAPPASPSRSSPTTSTPTARRTASPLSAAPLPMPRSRQRRSDTKGRS